MKRELSFAVALGCTALIVSLVTAAPSAQISPSQERADRFLDLANADYQALRRVQMETAWEARTDVSPAHDAAAEVARRACAAFVGNPALITEAKALLVHRSEIDELSIRQLERLLLAAAEYPMTNPALVEARVAAETRQESTLNSFEFQLHGRPVTPNEIDRLLRTSRDLSERLAVWEASKASGPALKPGLIRLRDLRNGVAREVGYPDYFALQMAAYGMTTDEMLELTMSFMRDLRPLYLQLHTWVKHELAKRYGRPVPTRIPAHWLDNRWAQEWPGLVAAADYDRLFEGRSAEWIVRTAESFYTGLGLPALPASFWDRSDLFPVPAGNPRKKNTHAWADHLDLEGDIRSLMSVEPTAWWWGVSHHELGHGHYYACYARPGVPYLLRDSANPGFHEAVAKLGGMACWQEAHLKRVGLLPADHETDLIDSLLNAALSDQNGVIFLFWASGTMTHWEADIYASGLPAEQWNARWWSHVREFQGVEPPSQRGEDWCDAATKTHVNDAPSRYPVYAFATVLQYQLNDHIARNILHEPPQSCSYAGHPEVGAFLRGIMEKGATEDWHHVLRDAIGEDLSTRAMVDYFAPLMRWLEEQNKGRTIGWE